MLRDTNAFDVDIFSGLNCSSIYLLIRKRFAHTHMNVPSQTSYCQILHLNDIRYGHNFIFTIVQSVNESSIYDCINNSPVFKIKLIFRVMQLPCVHLCTLLHYVKSA